MPRNLGFTLGHQKVALELQFSGVLAGYTELTVIPTEASLRTLHLNARRCRIETVQCDGTDARFDYMEGYGVPDALDVHAHPQVKRALYASASQGAEGELRIQLPQPVRLESGGGANGAEAGGANGTEAGAEPEYAPISVRIYYMLEDVDEALQLVLPTPEAPYRVPHMYTRPTGANSARCWVPCVDSLWERCTWDLEFVVPRRLASTTDEGETSEEEDEVMVICSGELVEHAVHPNSPEKSVFSYTQPVATSVQHMAFCAGPFVLGRVVPEKAGKPGSAGSAGGEAGADGVEMLAFCLPEHEHELGNTVGFTRQALEYIGREYGSYPFGSFKMVFVDDALVDCHSAASLAVCSSDLLHPSSVIDQAFENRHILTHAVAFQWVGINIIQRTWADTWLIAGLSQHLAAMFLRRLLGNNEYRFRMKKDCDRLCAWDIAMPPLYQVGRSEPPDAQLQPFINLKAPLVLYLLDRRLCKMGASLGLGRVIPKVFLQAITGEMANNALGTHSFLRTCKKVSGADLRQFADQWIYGSGCPRFLCTATFNRKKLLIEMHVRQESPAYLYAQAHPENALASNPVPLWEGQMTVRIHEADGTPYEHVLDIHNEHQRYDVPFNTKYKRVRRNTKRFQARQAAAAAAAAGDEDAAEAIGMIDLGFSLGMWEDETERKRWKVADWTEEDEAIMASAPYEWIRLDADFEWMAQIQFEQPDYMWVSQLQRDRDVVAQLAAVHALSQMPSLITSSMLTRTVLVTKYFFRIRAEAAYGLANCALPHLDQLGLFHLFMLFRTAYCFDLPHGAGDDGATALDAPCIPKPNDFSDMADYFVRRALIAAIGRVRDHTGKTPPVVQRFFINLLKYNDNSTNRFVDDYYVAGIINQLASALIPADTGALSARTPGIDDEFTAEELALRRAACAEVERLQELDRLVPSFHNVITLASIDFALALMFANLRPLDLPLFLGYTREGNFAPVRVSALNALLLLRGLQHKVLTRYYFALLAEDESELVRQRLARGLCECLGVAMATGEFGVHRPRSRRDEAAALTEGDAPTDPTEDLAHVEADRLDAAAEMDALVRGLRREVGRSVSVREGFVAAVHASRDHADVRDALLKLAELLFKPSEELLLPSDDPAMADSVRASTAGEGVGTTRIKLMVKNAPGAAEAPGAAAAATASDPGAARPEGLKVVLPKGDRPKKPRPIAQGQAGGMSSSDLTACRNCIQKLMANKHGEPFLRPVDPVRDEAPDYFDVIKEPMDLHSVANKLQSGQYRDRFQFKEDVELIFRNAKTYTPDPKTWIYYEASRAESAFRQHWNRITKTLEQAAAKAAERQRDAPAAEHPEEHAEEHAEQADGAQKRTLKLKRSADGEAAAEPPKKRAIKLSLGHRSAGSPPAGSAPTGAGSPPAEGAPPAGSPPAPAPRKIGLKIKRKNDETPSARATPAEPSPAPQPQPQPQPQPPSQPAQPPPPAEPVMDKPLPGEEAPVQPKKCRQVLQTLTKQREAVIFLRPVDPVLDGAPTYYDEIRHPMDLSTIDAKLKDGAYSTMGDFASDVRLMLANCRQFNPPGTEPRRLEQLVSRTWRREWSNAMTRKLSYQGKRALQGMLTRLKQHPTGLLFLYAVDPYVSRRTPRH